MIKRIILFLIVGFVFTTLTLGPAIAAFKDPSDIIGGGGEPVDPYMQDYTESVYGSKTEFNQASYVNFADQYLINNFIDMIVGKEMMNAWLTTGLLPSPAIADYGLVGQLATLTGSLYTNRPVSSADYLAYIKQSLDIPTAHAQGIGFTGLSPLLPIWQITRNTAYAVFIVIFVVIGIMTMLRTRIDPRTVVSVQESIPRMVLALILITFSYAIAGLFVDIVAVLLNLIVTMFEPLINPDPAARNALRQALTAPGSNIFELLGRFLGTSGDVSTAINSILSTLFDQFPIPFVGGVLSWGGGGLARLIFLIVLLGAMFRVFFTLVTSYASILLLTILAPFQFLLGALPTQTTTGSWFRAMAVNILTFPAIGFLILITAIFMRDTGSPYFVNPGAFPATPGWQPPFLGAAAGVNQVRAIIAMGIILIMPNVKTLISEMLQYRESQAAQVGGTLAGAAGRIPVVGGLLGGMFR